MHDPILGPLYLWIGLLLVRQLTSSAWKEWVEDSDRFVGTVVFALTIPGLAAFAFWMVARHG